MEAINNRTMEVINNRYDTWFVVTKDKQTNGNHFCDPPNIDDIDAVADFLTFDKTAVENLNKSTFGKLVLEECVRLKSQNPGGYEVSPEVVEKINKIFPGESKEKQRNELTMMYKIVSLYNIHVHATHQEPRIYKRSITGFPVSVFLTTDKKLCGIFKDSMIANGTFKVIVDAVNLKDLQPFAYSMFKADINSPLSQKQKREVSYILRFNTEEFVEIFAVVSLLSKDGTKAKHRVLMEKCKEDVQTFAKDKKFLSMTPLEQVRFLKRCLKGLEKLHQNSVHHRDVKMDNFVITNEGIPKLTDFGFAIDHSIETSYPMSDLGSPFYFAPEIIKGWFLDQQGAKKCLEGEQIVKKGKQDLEALQIEKACRHASLNIARKSGRSTKRALKDLAVSHENELKIETMIQAGQLKILEGVKERASARSISSNIGTDMWAFGICLYGLRTQTFLVSDERCLLNAPQGELNQLFSKNPDPIESLNLRMLQINPNERITASAALQELERLENYLLSDF